jgi:hypothetical protein
MPDLRPEGRGVIRIASACRKHGEGRANTGAVPGKPEAISGTPVPYFSLLNLSP